MEKFAHPIYWRDVNLRGNHYPRKTPLVSLQAYAVPHLARIPFAEAVRGEFVDARVGQSWGPTWATVWFRLEAHVPDEWRGDEVHLLWDAGCEALVYSADGAPLQGLCGGGGDDRRAEYVLARPARGGERVTLYVEMACNEMFGAGDGMMIGPPNPNRHFTLGEAAIGAFDREKWELYVDFTIIADMAKVRAVSPAGAAHVSPHSTCLRPVRAADRRCGRQMRWSIRSTSWIEVRSSQILDHHADRCRDLGARTRVGQQVPQLPHGGERAHRLRDRALPYACVLSAEALMRPQTSTQRGCGRMRRRSGSARDRGHRRSTTCRSIRITCSPRHRRSSTRG